MTQITVATINLHSRHDRWLQRRELLVSQLIDTAPDLIGLQEVYRPTGQGRWLRNQINNRISGSSRQPYTLIQKRRRHLLHGYFEGVAILSKLPVLSHDAVSLGSGGRVALRTNVELPHGDNLDFVTLFLHPATAHRQTRQEQVLQLLGWLNQPNQVPLQVLVGGFNELPGGLAIKTMKQGYQSAFELHRDYEPVATFPTALSQNENPSVRPGRLPASQCLDYIFVSPAVDRVIDSRIICQQPSPEVPDLYPSDHVGLMARLQLGIN